MTIDSLSLAKIQEGHMANINKMAESGKLQIAGPFGDDGNWRGIFIFDAATEDEVKELLKDDPAIQSGRLAYEIHPWWTMPGGLFEVRPRLSRPRRDRIPHNTSRYDRDVLVKN